MKKLIGLVLLAAAVVCVGLLWPQESRAQCLSRGRVVVRNVAHHAAVRAVVHHDVVINAVPVLVAPDYYYSVSGGYRDALLADAIAYRVLAAQGVAQNLRKTSPLPRYADQPKDDAPKTMPRASAPSGPSAVPEALAKVVEAKCAKCHTAGKNGIDLGGAALAGLSRSQWMENYLRVSVDGEGSMPKGGPALSNDEVSLFASMALSAKR